MVGAPEFIRGKERFSAPENSGPLRMRFSAGHFVGDPPRGSISHEEARHKARAQRYAAFSGCLTALLAASTIIAFAEDS